MKVYFTDPEPADKKAKELLIVAGHSILLKKQQYSADVLFIRVSRKADEQFLDNFKNLKYLLTGSVGTDNIDNIYCRNRDIRIINAPGSNANSVSEHVIGLTLMLLRNIDIHRDELEQGRWRKDTAVADEISGKIIGLVGCGAIGRLIAEKFTALGAEKIIGFDPNIDGNILISSSIHKVTLSRLIKEADIITLHLPLTSETRGLISLKELRMMKDTAYLINTSRGGIVNEKDLIFALNNKIIQGAALDVFEREPDIHPHLLHTPNLICTPHIAGFTKQARLAMTIEPVKKFLRLTDNRSAKSFNIVNNQDPT